MKINIKKIRKKKLKEVEKIKKQFQPEIYRAAALSAGTEFRSVEVNLKQSDRLPVLVEIGGTLRPSLEILENIQPTRIARDLEANGLQTAVVVTTDDLVWGGHPGWINLVKYHTQLPVIARDFFFHPIQIYQARATGADAVIIDFQWVDEATGSELVNAAFEMGMEPIVQLPTAQFPSGVDTEIVSAVLVSPPVETSVTEVVKMVSALHTQLEGKIPVIAETLPETESITALVKANSLGGLLLTSHLFISPNYLQRFADILALVKEK